MSIQKVFESFMEQEFESAVDSATRASWGGDGYSVELFNSGKYRVLYNGEIGNLYYSPGLILPIPFLGQDEWDEDPTLRFYDNAEKEMRNVFEEKQ